MTFEKVLVANRGEIAVRVMEACEELEISTVAVYSDADDQGGHVRYAEEAYNVGPARAADSYLDHEAIIEAAQSSDADAIHPCYGFLAENAEFAAKVEETDGITWIGPPGEAMERLGEKTHARQIMQKADVPIVPGTTDPVEDPEQVTEFGDKHGYPIAIKAEGGGGGRGMKVVESPDEVEDQLESAKREGEAYFDNDSVYLERYLEDPKHIEVQIIADNHDNVRHLGERDCSLQRRHQKVIEEGPSPTLSDELRESIGEAARRGISESEYTNAGTVEFLVEDGEFYFLEVNTRIQVEHCVTEEITGIDIVRKQIRVAQDEELDFSQDAVKIDGHAIEFRINAENPAEDFQPVPGHLETYDPPGGMGVRIDDAVRQGDDVSGDYDSMIAKLIVHAEDREAAIARGRRALAQFDIEGLHTIIPFHRLMLEDDVFCNGTHTTKYIDRDLDHGRIEEAVDRWGPEQLSDAKGSVVQNVSVEVDERRHDVRVFGGAPLNTPASGTGTTGSEAANPTTTGDGTTVVAEMQGTVLSVDVSEGDEVGAGDRLLVLEAMKMENDIVAEVGGTVSTVAVTEGESVDMQDILVIIE